MLIIILQGNRYLKKKSLSQMYFVTCPNPIVRLNVINIINQKTALYHVLSYFCWSERTQVTIL